MALALRRGEVARYRFDVDDGFVIARKVAARALEGLPADRPFLPRGR